MEKDFPYSDILQLPHHVSALRPRMSMEDRAAQFSPFAALTGYDAAIQETGRLTVEKLVMDEDALNILNKKFHLLLDRLEEAPEVTVTYFRPDGRKVGGAYVDVTGIVKKADSVKRLILMEDGLKIPIDDILDIRGEIFPPEEFTD